MLWHDILTLMDVFHYSEPNDKQAAYNRLLSNLTVPFVPQLRQMVT